MLRPYFFGCTFPRHGTPAAMTDLKRSLRLFDGLAMVVGIMVGSGIFRTPGLVAAQLGRPWLTFVAWVLGGALAFLGALCFAELATRHPRAGGKYVYVREAFGSRDRKSTRLNSSHLVISYAVFCLKKKKNYHSRATASKDNSSGQHTPRSFRYHIPLHNPTRRTQQA